MKDRWPRPETEYDCAAEEYAGTNADGEYPEWRPAVRNADIREETIMAGKSTITTDHDEIRRWAEERGGRPAIVKGTDGNDNPGILRFEFPGGRDNPSLQLISWEEFFETFDKANLALIYEEKTRTGRPSRFLKFVDRDAGTDQSGKAA